MSLQIDPNTHPHLAHLTLTEILDAADRWKALETIPNVQVVLADGFSENDRERAPAQRLLMLSLKTRPEFDSADDAVSAHLRTSALSKLTDLADLMRAAKIEASLA